MKYYSRNDRAVKTVQAIIHLWSAASFLLAVLSHFALSSPALFLFQSAFCLSVNRPSLYFLSGCTCMTMSHFLSRSLSTEQFLPATVCYDDRSF